MIARLMGEGQYRVDDELRGQLNELDDRGGRGARGDDEPALDGVLDEMASSCAARASGCPTTTSPRRT